MVPTRLDLQQRSQADSRLTTHSSLTRQDATTANLLTIVGRPRDAQYATFSFLTADDAVADDKFKKLQFIQTLSLIHI